MSCGKWNFRSRRQLHGGGSIRAAVRWCEDGEFQLCRQCREQPADGSSHRNGDRDDDSDFAQQLDVSGPESGNDQGATEHHDNECRQRAAGNQWCQRGGSERRQFERDEQLSSESGCQPAGQLVHCSSDILPIGCGKPHTITITGLGTQPLVSLTPTSVDLGSGSPGQAARPYR